MQIVIALQLAIAVATALVAWLVFGENAGISAALGGMSCVVPSAVYVFVIYAERLVCGKNRTVTPFVAELVKIAMTVGFLAVAAFRPGLNWAAMLIAFALALGSYLLALVLRI